MCGYFFVRRSNVNHAFCSDLALVVKYMLMREKPLCWRLLGQSQLCKREHSTGEWCFFPGNSPQPKEIKGKRVNAQYLLRQFHRWL